MAVNERRTREKPDYIYLENKHGSRTVSRMDKDQNRQGPDFLYKVQSELSSDYRVNSDSDSQFFFNTMKRF